MPKKLQLEITTRCNFDCFYCAGRHMPQKDMPMELVHEILNQHLQPGMEVNLQGEGEPVLTKNFWRIVELVHERGGLPYVITNAGYTITPDMAGNFRKYFNRILVSLDTTDPARAEEIGRFNVQRVMENILRFKEILGRDKVGIVAVGISKQDVESVFKFAAENDIPEVGAQSLQTKDDYMIKYKVKYQPAYHLRCRYLENDLMRFFNVDGVEMPCCFIKDVRQYVSAQDLRDKMNNNIVPASCKGCRYIRHQNPPKVIATS